MENTETIIELGRGYVTKVNSDTFTRLNLGGYRWGAQVHKRAGKVYAVASRGGCAVYLHRLIVGAGKGQQADHRDRDGLNNLDENVRLATPGQNRANCAVDRDNRCGLKGVTWARTSRKWMAQIVAGGRKYYLGVFEHKQRAAIAHDAAALAIHGEFAGLNYPDRNTRPRLPAGYVKA